MEFVADFTVEGFFMVLDIALVFAFFPTFLSFSSSVGTNLSFGSSRVALGSSSSSIQVTSLETSSSFDWSAEPSLDSCCMGFFSISSSECLTIRTSIVSLCGWGSAVVCGPSLWGHALIFAISSLIVWLGLHPWRAVPVPFSACA